MGSLASKGNNATPRIPQRISSGAWRAVAVNAAEKGDRLLYTLRIDCRMLSSCETIINPIKLVASVACGATTIEVVHVIGLMNTVARSTGRSRRPRQRAPSLRCAAPHHPLGIFWPDRCACPPLVMATEKGKHYRIGCSDGVIVFLHGKSSCAASPLLSFSFM